MDLDKLINNLACKFKLTKYQLEEFINIAEPIIKHQEFQKRLTNEFYHHDNITLGEHILSVAMVTYKLSIHYVQKHNDYNVKLAVLIALFHDLYTLPWQNNKDNVQKYFFNKHGFRHPIEAVINAVSWYPEYFKNKEEAKIIIDGMVHHMFPFPVRVIDRSNLELKNQELYNNMPLHLKRMLIKSSKRGKIKKIGIALSKYKEGRIVSKADKKVSMSLDLKSLSGLTALVTGHNKNLDNEE